MKLISWALISLSMYIGAIIWTLTFLKFKLNFVAGFSDEILKDRLFSYQCSLSSVAVLVQQALLTAIGEDDNF